MKRSLLSVLCIGFAVITLLAGCSGSNPDKETSTTPEAQPSTASPKSAIEEIYKDVTIKDIGYATDEEVTDVLGMNLDDMFSYCIMYSKGNYGVMDTYIIQPKPDKLAEIRSQLEARQDAMIRTYEHYDIYESYEISQNALIYEQGDYLIMLMHKDNDAVRNIIDQYIPSK